MPKAWRLKGPQLQRRSDSLRLAYFGRIDRTKGIDVLVEALSRAPHLSVALDVYGIAPNSKDQALVRLEAAARRDTRIRVLRPVEPAAVTATMANYDLVAVPSRCLETGPLVVLEAFAAGVPVIGSNRGGIAELLRHGIDGVLVAPEDASAWSRELSRLASDRSEIARLTANLTQSRTMTTCAAEMVSLYSNLLSRSG
jgi:glycosyltransferase involved in cell wall biosynthesis